MFRGPCTVVLPVTAPREVRLTNESPFHNTYVDLFRPDQSKEKRLELGVGDSELVSLLPGDVEIVLGPSTVMEDA